MTSAGARVAPLGLLAGNALQDTHRTVGSRLVTGAAW
jgi:hypothetical protein